MEEKKQNHFLRNSVPDFLESEIFSELLVYELLGVPVYKYPNLEYTLCPNKRIGNILKSIERTKTKMGVIVRLIALAGVTPALWLLLTRGISSGLSGGTMDIIYRVGIPKKVFGLLDNIDIAVGSYQRRFQIEEVLIQQIRTKNYEQIITIAGGSGLIPIEAIYQSQKRMRLINIDKSDKALRKMKNNIAKVNDQIQLIYPVYITEDISKIANITPISGSKTIVECTGYIEYLDFDDKTIFVKRLSEILDKEDVLILTALTQNQQQLLFEKIGFKKLFPIKIEELILLLQENHLHVHKAFLTPNDTYATIIITKYHDEEVKLSLAT